MSTNETGRPGHGALDYFLNQTYMLTGCVAAGMAAIGANLKSDCCFWGFWVIWLFFGGCFFRFAMAAFSIHKQLFRLDHVLSEGKTDEDTEKYVYWTKWRDIKGRWYFFSVAIFCVLIFVVSLDRYIEKKPDANTTTHIH